MTRQKNTFSLLIAAAISIQTLAFNDSLTIQDNIQPFDTAFIANKEIFLEMDSMTSLQTLNLTQANAVNRMISSGYAVGEIPIQSGVSPMGARTYSVPVEAYPGIGGMTPQISLAYNSMQGNGVVGVGWSIAGLSSIIRSNKTIHYDGQTSGITNNSNDVFTLDGQRLIRMTDENGSPCYLTAQGNVKVRATLSGNNINSFTVLYPDGRTGIYSSSDDGKMVYPLRSMTDIDGHTITYTYTCTQNNHLIQTITYNTSAKIEFTYDDERMDYVSSYSNGLLMELYNRLSKITCKWGNNVLGEYTLSYTEINGSSHLEEIGYTAGGQSLNPLTFTYGEGETSDSYETRTIMLDYANITSEPTHNKHTRIAKGKFDYTNSDGILSFVNRNPYTYALVLDPSTGFPACAIGNIYNDHPNDLIYVTPDLENNNSLVTTLPIGQGFVDALCMDLTGTQEDYIVRVNNNKVNDTDQISFSAYRYSNEQNTCTHIYTRTYNVGTVFSDVFSNKSLRPKHFHTGDFNGDGRQDIMVIICQAPLYDTNTTTQCKIYDISNNTLIYSGTPFSCNAMIPTYWGEEYTYDQIENMDRLFVMDYNGDGKSDICLINANGINIYEFSTTGESINSCSLIHTTTELNRSSLKNRQFMPGDFNGDGLADFLLSPKRNNSDMSWKIFYSKGNGQFATESYGGIKAQSGDCDDFIVQDVNSDGKSDLIECHKDKFVTFINENNIPNVEVCTCIMDECSAIVPTSITSHNYFSHVLTLKDDKLVKHSYRNDVSKQRLLTSVTNSFNNVEYTTYKYPYDDGASYGVQPTDVEYPYVVLREKIPFIASSYELFDGYEQNNISYQFYNLVIHRQGLGACGMERVVTNGEQFITEQEYSPALYGMLIHESSRAKSNNSLISEGEYSYNIVHPHNNPIVQVNLTGKVIKDHLQDFTTTSAYSYNQYGFPITETATTSDGYTITSTQNVTHHTSTGYMLNVVNEKTVSTTLNGMTHTEKITFPEMLYDKPLKKYSYINNNQVSYETFTYSTQGLLSQKTIKHYSSTNTQTTSYQYDTYGRLLKETTPELWTKTYLYNSKGEVSSYTNELGNTETYTYDAFGRKTRTDFADGTQTFVTYNWEEGNPFNLLGYTVTERHSNGHISTTMYDAKHRIVGTETPTALTGALVTYTSYNTYGNKVSQTLPFKYNTTKYYDRYTYDIYNRPIQIRHAIGKYTTYAYNKNIVTTVEDGIVTTRTYDSQGNMISVTDSTGTTTYTYRPDGQMLSATVPCGLTTNMVYDGYGRQTSLVDPCAGTTYFGYDASGNMDSKVDGADNEALMWYDTFGRMVHKEYVGTLATTYTYNNKGLLEMEEDSNGGLRLFEYDQYGRLHRDITNIGVNGEDLLRQYAYSSTTGDLTAINYVRDGEELGTELFSYNNGVLKKTSFISPYLSDTVTVWEVKEETNQGLTSTAASGPLTHNFAYDQEMRPVAIRTMLGSSVRRYMTYGYNAITGNMMMRKNNVRNVQENFTYDHMNRLTGDGTNSFDYDTETGNMTYNTHVGYLAYGQLSPSYRLSAIDPITVGGLSSNYMSTDKQTAVYNAMSRPASITENNHTIEFTYNGHAERTKSLYYKKETPSVLEGTITTILETRYYLGGVYEHHITGDNESDRMILYLGGDAYSSPAAFVIDSEDGPLMQYICRDHQGSITHLISSNGDIQEYSYDAWGNLRNPSTLALYTPRATQGMLYLGRGYTGHEHHGYFGLINMNARMYEPIVGRFISPDPFVQMPDNSQNFNRYTYCLNNPLRYTDESGEFIDLLAVFMFSGSISLISDAISGNLNSLEDALASFAIGGLAGAAGAGVSSAISCAFTCSGFAGGVVSGTFGGFTGGFISGAGQAWYNGAGFWNGLAAGYGSGLINAGTSAITQGITCGFDARSEGFSFWDGSITAEIHNPNIFQFDSNTDYLKLAEEYNASSQKITNDAALQKRVHDTYKLRTGENGISNITTASPKGYGMSNEGYFVDMKSKKTLAGLTRGIYGKGSTVHISKPIAINPDIVTFKATVGHELIHAYQIHTIPKLNLKAMEAQAYRYTYNVYKNAHNSIGMKQIMNHMKDAGLWNNHKYQKLPTFLK